MEVKFGFRAVTEEYSPTELLRQIISAEAAGFDFVTASDHFHPWFHTNAQASQAWLVLAAASSLTKKIEIGTGITSPFSRYHPAIVAQSFATLQYLSNGRAFLSVGTGEAMNEVPLSLAWASYKERSQQLREAVEIIKKLWSEEFATFEGQFFALKEANLYTKPKKRPAIYMAASGPRSAKIAGMISDGLYTFPAPKQIFLEKLFPAFKEGVKTSGRNVEQVEKIIELLVSFDPDYDKALTQIAHWRSTLISEVLNRDIYDPRILEAEGSKIPLEDLSHRWVICTNIEDFISTVEEYIKLGFTRIEIHSSTSDQEAFMFTLKRHLNCIDKMR